MPVSVHVGMRVQLDTPEGGKGTVKYVGPIEGAKNPVYVGIHFDEQRVRGHDGLIKGRRYFECPAGYGGCVHPKRVLLGKRLMDGIRIRYGGVRDPDEARIEIFRARTEAKEKDSAPQASSAISRSESGNSSNSGNPNVNFELVGEAKLMDKLKQFHTLENVSLEGLRISVAGDTNEIKGLSSLTSLNLENNLFNDWMEVSHICRNLTRLEELRLGGNMLPLLLANPAVDIFKNSTLKILVLNQLQHACEAVAVLGASGQLSLLEELHLCYNNLTSLPKDAFGQDPTQAFPNLSLVNLEYNSISCFEDIRPVTNLPRLSMLMLGFNKLTRLNPSILMQCRNVLEALYMQDNILLENVNSLEGLLEIVDTVEQLPKLKSLRVIRNAPLDALFDNDTVKLRMYLIARLPQLDQLNLSQIRTKERVSAERYYLNWCKSVSKDSKENHSPEKFKYYRDYELKHGEQKSEKESRPAKLSDKLLHLNFSYDGKEKKKRVPGSIQVSKLCVLARRLFKLGRATDIKLSLKTVEDGHVMILDDEMLPLRHYPVQSGDKIIVSDGNAA
mmetsp:Transcript_17187/g.42154  ORF Transcript_17187/g.42154 Transcript_17187/m.42154 type:complete len:559 (-) Transcript_17187:209-1885(-)